VVLSARGAEPMKVRALDLGADDYVQKPFGVEELLARVRAGLRHGVQARGSAPVLRAGDLEIDLGRRRVLRAGAAVRLTPKEYDLLAELAIHHERPVTHAELLATVWGGGRTDIQYLRVYIVQLRQKLGAGRILSAPGVGYQLAMADDGSSA
jgi:two-component system, OmpR family, KDP operon response regulator KdpE